MRVSYWWQRQIKRAMFHQLKGQIPRRTITPSITDYMDEPIAIAFLQSKGILPEIAKRCHIGFDKNWINPLSSSDVKSLPLHSIRFVFLLRCRDLSYRSQKTLISQGQCFRIVRLLITTWVMQDCFYLIPSTTVKKPHL